ncbi:hypothetical protein CPC08DRAFT_697307 [Agrocybe pediades]|nr:hypothetical protein CPC08DRAFT_697307 [Agrocybe pediades]
MYGQPWYSGYQYPTAYPSYGAPYRNPYQVAAYQGGYDYDDADLQERARALAERRARRAQYLPDEDDDDVDDWEYNQFGPQQRAYLEAKRRQLIEERRQQEEAARERARQELLAKQRAEQEESFRGQHAPHSGAQADSSIPIHFQPSSSPSKASPPPSRSRSATPPPPKHTPEELNEAASKIQNRYRIHSSFKILDDAANQFASLKKGFVYPRAIDFQKPGADSGYITVGAYRAPSDFDNEDEEPMQVNGPEGKLDYTSTNYPLHAYMEALNKLLLKLDGVESWGKKAIRDKRRTIVKSIEKEASKLDRYCRQAWLDYLAKQAKDSQPQPEPQVEEVVTPQTTASERSEPQSSQIEASEVVPQEAAPSGQQAEDQPPAVQTTDPESISADAQAPTTSESEEVDAEPQQPEGPRRIPISSPPHESETISGPMDVSDS